MAKEQQQKIQEQKPGADVTSILFQLGTQLDNIKNTYNNIILRYEWTIQEGIKSGAIDKEKFIAIVNKKT